MEYQLVQSICKWSTAFVLYSFLTSQNVSGYYVMFSPEQPFWVIRRLKQGGDISFIQSMKGVKMQLHSALMHNICVVLSVSTCT